MVIKVANIERGPAGKLADVELHFTEGPLAGLKLVGFAVWESKRGHHVTYPARTYSVNGDRRSFALLRPTGFDASAQDRLKAVILEAFRHHQNLERAAGEALPDSSRVVDAPASPVAAEVPPFDADAVAAALWARFDSNERHGVKLGIFPALKMRAAEGLTSAQQHAVTVALMSLASAAATRAAVAAGSAVGSLEF